MQSELETAFLEESKLKTDITETSTKLLNAIDQMAAMDETHSELTTSRKALVSLMDSVFEQDKGIPFYSIGESFILI
jgi:hypothetical protein